MSKSGWKPPHHKELADQSRQSRETPAERMARGKSVGSAALQGHKPHPGVSPEMRAIAAEAKQDSGLIDRVPSADELRSSSAQERTTQFPSGDFWVKRNGKDGQPDTYEKGWYVGNIVWDDGRERIVINQQGSDIYKVVDRATIRGWQHEARAKETEGLRLSVTKLEEELDSLKERYSEEDQRSLWLYASSTINHRRAERDKDHNAARDYSRAAFQASESLSPDAKEARFDYERLMVELARARSKLAETEA